jgi:hypothetical protein
MLTHAEALIIVRTLIRQRPWRLKLGVGSFVTIEFGKPEANPSGLVRHGEWHLWLYMCNWKLKRTGKALADSQGDRTSIESVFQNLELGSVKEVRIPRSSVDLQIEFDSGVNLWTTSTSKRDKVEQWMLFTPERKCLSAFGNQSYEYAPIDESRPRK